MGRVLFSFPHRCFYICSLCLLRPLSLFPFLNPSLILCPTTEEYHHHISIVAAQIRRHGQQQQQHTDRHIFLFGLAAAVVVVAAAAAVAGVGAVFPVTSVEGRGASAGVGGDAGDGGDGGEGGGFGAVFVLWWWVVSIDSGGMAWA